MSIFVLYLAHKDGSPAMKLYNLADTCIYIHHTCSHIHLSTRRAVYFYAQRIR